MHDINIYKPRISEGMTLAPTTTVLAMNQSWRDLGQEKNEKEQAESLDNVNIVDEGDTHPNWVETELQGYTNGPVEQQVKVSISHDGDYATAVCLAAEEPWKAKQPRGITGQPWR
jgi:hypothetical protein